MRGAVLAHTYAVVGEDEDGVRLHDRREADRGAHIVGEHEERAGVRDEPAVHRHAVDDVAHGMLPYAEVDVSAVSLARPEVTVAVEMRVVRGCEVGRAADQFREACSDGVQHLAGSGARGHGAVRRAERRDRGLPIQGEGPGLDATKARGICREIGGVGLEARAPISFRLLPPGHGLAKFGECFLGDEERGVLRPVESLLREPHFVLAERIGVGLGRAGLVRAAVTNDCLRNDQGGTLGLVSCTLQAFEDLVQVVAIDVGDVPAVGLEALAHVLGEGQRCLAFDRDVVVVVQVDQLAEPARPGEGRRFRRDSLHQVAVATEAVRVVVDDGVAGLVELRGQPPFGERHANAHRKACPERPGSDLHARRFERFGVTRRAAPPLTELL